MEQLSALFSIVSLLCSGGIFIIQQMTRNEITQAKLDIMSMMKKEFASTDRVDGLADRLDRLEQSRAHGTH